MEQIDTSGWNVFKVGDLFEVSRPVARSQAKYKEGSVPFVASGNYNNGVVKWCEPLEGEALDWKGCITVSPLDGAAFYQPVDFLGRGGAGSAILLLRSDNLTEMSGLFISAVLRAALTKFSYNDQINSQNILVQEIKLPATVDGKPDFAYMDEYMRNEMKESEASLENLMQADKSRHLVDIQGWKSFCLGKLFDVVKGTRLTKADQRDGQINFISASSFNNGIAATISNDDHIHPGNTMTVSYNGSDIGRTFYQEEPFWASDDVNVLYPKFPLTKNIALFIAPIIKTVGGSHVYKNKWLQEDMKVAEIMLPVASDGNPDWDYMDRYMCDMLAGASVSIGLLAEVAG